MSSLTRWRLSRLYKTMQAAAHAALQGMSTLSRRSVEGECPTAKPFV